MAYRFPFRPLAESDADARRSNTTDLSAGRPDFGTMDSVVTRLSRLGALTALLLAVVVAAPAVLVSGAGSTLGAFYAAGPFGLTAVGFLAVVAVIVFLATTQEHTDTLLISGVALVVAVAAALLAVVWLVTLDETVLFSFPSEYAWLASYRYVVVAAAVLVAAVAGALSARVL